MYSLVSRYPSVPLRAIIYIKYDVKASVLPLASGKSPFSPSLPSFVLKHTGEEQETLSLLLSLAVVSSVSSDLLLFSDHQDLSKDRAQSKEADRTLQMD